MNNLPDFCYSQLTPEDNIILLFKGAQGFLEVEDTRGKTVEELNNEIGVTPVQERCMKMGSLFGFNTPGANPESYEDFVQNTPSVKDSEPIKYEILLQDVLNKHFGNWSKCEEYWEEKTESSIKNYLDCLTQAMPNTYENNSWIKWGSPILETALNGGQCVGLPFIYVRLKNDSPKCPKCGGSYKDGLEAISRRDNGTKICPRCGVNEGLEDLQSCRTAF